MVARGGRGFSDSCMTLGSATAAMAHRGRGLRQLSSFSAPCSPTPPRAGSLSRLFFYLKSATHIFPLSFSLWGWAHQAAFGSSGVGTTSSPDPYLGLRARERAGRRWRRRASEVQRQLHNPPGPGGLRQLSSFPPPPPPAPAFPPSPLFAPSLLPPPFRSFFAPSLSLRCSRSISLYAFLLSTSLAHLPRSWSFCGFADQEKAARNVPTHPSVATATGTKF